jgi:hypothetical protein
MKIKARRTVAVAIISFIAALWMPLRVAGNGPSRIVAIGDIHGALPELLDILQKIGLIDGSRQWTGGSATLIQTGDAIDRGAQSRGCLDLLMDLELQAEKAGGRVIPLFGNHEAMNIMGDLRDVTPEIYRTFATDKSEKIREQAYQDYVKLFKGRRDSAHAAESELSDSGRQKWMEVHPPGFFEYRDAMGPNGTYGRWIRKHRVIFQAADGLFVHGGLNPALKFKSIAEFEDQIHAELSEFDVIWKLLCDKKLIWRYMQLEEAVSLLDEELKSMESSGQVEDSDTLQAILTLAGYKSWMAVSYDGPLWYRGLAQDPEDEMMDSVLQMLARLKAKFIVDSHSVISRAAITQRFENHVFLIDTGMLTSEYSGRASALEIKDGQFTAYYADEDPKVLVAPADIKKTPAVSPRTR